MSDIIKHYGVKGMKWGVRKSDILSGAGSSSMSNTNSGKTGLKYGNIPVTEAGFDQKVVAEGRKKANELMDRVGDAPLTPVMTPYRGNAKFKKDESLKHDMDLETLKKKVVDPVNPEYGDVGTVDNCVRTTYAYEMRRRGYDVRATKSFGEDQNHASIYNAHTKGKQYLNTSDTQMTKVQENAHKMDQTTGLFAVYNESMKNTSYNGAKGLFKKLEGQPNGSRGNAFIYFRNGAAHSIAYEIKGGKPVLIDAQRGAIFQSPKEMNEYKIPIGLTNFARLDNKELNMDQMQKWVTNA